jgi:hypothetical protein
LGLFWILPGRWPSRHRLKIGGDQAVTLTDIWSSGFVRLPAFAVRVGIAGLDDIMTSGLGAMLRLMGKRVSRHVCNSNVISPRETSLPWFRK